jgi:lipopolysaccharide transport system ATP-binding protein
MSTAAIEGAGIGKRYKLGKRSMYKSLRESIVDTISAPGRWARGLRNRPANAGEDVFWALKDVSFRVEQGEVIGIIGRNGAGKSTLLKILSRITDPTEGRIVLNGRVASLLEVGTGFHPELSGRENIYLNGAILGMRRFEIQRHFDEIVEFAEVEKFLDTSVKHYSSGMYMRLAFSVAAHLEPEILLVDEVLAVGDASFQRKCLNKMDSVSKRGRTVFFVSHNMPAVTRLCPRAIMLDRGRVFADGPAPQVTTAYLRSGLGTVAAREWPDPSTAPADSVVRLRGVRVRTGDGTISETVEIESSVSIEMDYDVLTAGKVLVPNFGFYNEDGVCLFVAHDLSPEWRGKPRPCGSYRSSVFIPGNFFSEGTIVLNAAVSTHDPVAIHVLELDAIAFQIVDRGNPNTARGDYAGPMPGVIRPLFRWTTATMAETASAAR